MRAVKVVAINAVVLVGLVVATNVISATILIFDPLSSAGSDDDGWGDRRVSLPNYPDKRRAAAIFADFRQSKQHVVFVPFLEWKREPYNGPTATINRDGDRVTPRPHGGSPPRGETVRFFGGSSMWGTGVDDHGTIPAWYQRLHPRALVYNHGESGYNTRQNLERLINLINQGQRVDKVIFYEGYNDVGTLCRTDVSINGQDQERKMRNLLERGQSRIVDIGPSLATAVKTLLVGRTQQLILKLRGEVPQEDEKMLGDPGSGDYYCDVSRARARQVASTVLNDLRMARTLVRAAGGRFMAILQPVGPIGRPRIDHLQGFGGLARELRAVYPIWQAAAQRMDWFYDFTSAFDGDNYIYIDRVHVSEVGNEIIARRVSRILAPPQ